MHSLILAMPATVMVVLTVALMIPACTNLWWMMHAWRSPRVNRAIVGPAPSHTPGTSFSAIVPFRHEAEAVVRETVERLTAQTHHEVEIVLCVGHDDSDAQEIGWRLAALWPQRVMVIVDHHWAKTKPRQLNTALSACTKEYVAVFDAESLTHPELFSHADALLIDTSADVLQYGVQLVNHRTAWFSLRNCLEYFFWFRSRLHLHALHGFIPLGGNTLFIRRSLLLDMGGWDASALTEDCDLGVRLSAHGVRVEVAYDARLVTREDRPESVSALLRQRSRWNQGFLQVLAKGEWRALPTRRQRLLARYTLLQPYVQALTLIAYPVGLTVALLAGLPLAVAMLTFLPLGPWLMTMCFEAVALHEFGRALGVLVGPVDYVRLVLSAVPYQMVMAWAAFRAVLRDRRGHLNWEKTPHAGHHLAPRPAEAVGA